MEFTKLDALRKKCCADDYAWFSYDITNQGGHKAFLAVKNDDLFEFSKTLNENKLNPMLMEKSFVLYSPCI